MRFLLVLVLSLWAAGAQAGGSVEFTNVRALLHGQPAFEALLTKALDVENVGWAVRLGRQFEHLGGARIGPYTFKAKPHGTAGPDTLEVTICTQPTFMGDDGRPAKDITTAARVTETITSVVVREAAATGYANCGGEATPALQ